MKKLIILLAFGMCSANVIADGIMSKQNLKEMIEGAFEENLCNKTYNTCMNVTKTTCLAEAKNIFNKKCSEDIPDVLEELDEVRAYVKSTASCTSKKYIENHYAAIKKNAKTPACQSMMKGK